MINFEIMEHDVEFRGKTITVNGALGYGPNWTFTGKMKEVKGVGVYQIIALDEFYCVTPGTIGGWISAPDCLCQEDRSWIAANVVVIDSIVDEDSYVDAETTIINSVIKATKINEEQFDEMDRVLTISDSTLNNVVFNGEGSIRRSKLKKTRINEIAKDYPDVQITDTHLDNFVLSSEEIKISGSVLTALDMTANGSINKVQLAGAVSMTHRPEIYLEGEFPSECCDVKYKGYLPVEEYDDQRLKDVLLGMKASTKTVETSYGSIRADIAEFLGL